MREPGALLDAVVGAVPDFRAYLDGLGRRQHDADDALLRVLALPDLASALPDGRVGARPGPEHEPGRVAVRHAAAPVDHAASVAFAERVLAATPAAFVDGSQVPVSDDVDVPFGVVNVSGSHARPGHPLARHQEAVVVGPGELAAWRERGVWAPQAVVDFRRWALEMEYLVRCMEAEPGTVAVFDGSLVHSFTTGLAAPLRAAYAEVRDRALAVSEATGSPLVGYVDASRARDLVELVAAVEPIESAGLTDAALVAPHLDGLGDRTTAWWCDRADGSADELPSPVAFWYTLLGPGGPKRVEVPGWVLEAGPERVGTVQDALLAHCLAGGGYPRGIDENHRKCSVTHADAAAVHAAFLRLAQEHGLPVRGSWKARSKKQGVGA